MDELDELDFDDLDLDGAGDLLHPTLRGNANLDVQDYQRLPGIPDSSILDDDLQEDVRSTPGSGAAPAPDIDGLVDFDFNDLTEDDPDMAVTAYGSHPWAPGGGGGYRPYSMDTDLSGEPANPSEEVAIKMAAQGIRVGPSRRNPQANREPSNAAVDPETIYDRESYEIDDDPQAVIGGGIFDMEEGVVWRGRDGIFANDYAYPAYMAHEGETDVQQSEMWDSVANNWRVTQPSAGGVTLKRKVKQLDAPISPFVVEMRPERTGPRSHVEAFGRRVAKAIVDEARIMPTSPQRSVFITNAIEALGPGMSQTCRQVAERLVQLGYPSDQALENTIAHCVMHATVNDLSDRARGKRGLPRIDKMGSGVRTPGNKAQLHAAAADHLVPLATDNAKAQSDVKALYASPAASGMGQVAPSETTAAPAANNMNRNLLIGAAVAGVGYLLLTKTKEGQKVQRNVRRGMRQAARKARRIL